MITAKISCVAIAAFLLDYAVGDPQNPFHPMRLIGKGIAWGVARYKRLNVTNPTLQFVFGVVLTLVIVSLSYGVAKCVTFWSYRLHPWFGFAVESVLCYFLIAAKALRDESMKVYHAAAAGDIISARKYLSFIVGRDTQNLDSPGIIRAVVETVAENLSDGVIAPLLYIFIGGAPLGMAYKAINTLDSMIGYRNDEYEYFGKCAARLDDAANYIPARVSALLMILASALTGGNAGMAARIYLRDRRNHKSPNSAQTESACAGALGLRLGGDHYYQGILVRKPLIGDDLHKPALEHIIAANRLMYASAVGSVIVFTAIRAISALLGRGSHV